MKNLNLSAAFDKVDLDSSGSMDVREAKEIIRNHYKKIGKAFTEKQLDAEAKVNK